MSKYKQYIGDGAFADFDGFSIVLTTEDGISAQNRIVLEPAVWVSLKAYVTELTRKLKEEYPDETLATTRLSQ